MVNSWPVVLPPLIVLLSAFLTHNIFLSLGLGIVSAGLIATYGQPFLATQLIWQHFVRQITDLDNLYIFAFLILISMLVILLSRSGGATALARPFTQRLRSKRAAQIATVSMSFFFFIDDYLNCLTVGNIMRPITDRLKIPRAKLAYLLDSMTAPLAIIAPISSWAGTITSQLVLAGVSFDLAEKPLIYADAFSVYLTALPFVFYSFIAISTVWFIIYKKISFGLMYQHEKLASETGNLCGGKPIPHDHINDETVNRQNGSIWDFILPIGLLIISVFLGVLYWGDYYWFGGCRTKLIEVFRQKYNIFPILFYSALLSLTISAGFALIRRKLQFKQLWEIITKGPSLMMGAILMVLISWVFGALLRENLHTGQYLATLLLGSVNPAFLPFMIFVVSATIAIATGSAWGTLAIVIPITIPMIISLLKLTPPVNADAVHLLIPALGAMFSGAAAGDHISPVSDTTVMSASSSGAYLLDHVKTQLGYALPAIIATGVAFLVSSWLGYASFYRNIIISLPIGILTCFSILLALNHWQKIKSARQP